MKTRREIRKKLNQLEKDFKKFCKVEAQVQILYNAGLINALRWVLGEEDG